MSEKTGTETRGSSPVDTGYESTTAKELGGHLDATADDILEAKEIASTLSLDKVRSMMKHVVRIHEGDQNFPFSSLQVIKAFLANDDIMANPEKPEHDKMIKEMKLEAALILHNSPYAEVRAVVDNHDDPAMPVSTVRAWTIGMLFVVVMAIVNQLFSIRMPSILLMTDVSQLLAFPLAKGWERWIPRGVYLTIPPSGHRVELNPGRFNKKEHMLIAIISGMSVAMPYSNQIFWVQYLPFYFNQPHARNFGYMLVNNLATSFIGYGMAGVARRFLVYPSYCVWPASLVAIALNRALHDEDNQSVPGPLGRIWSMSRYRFFFLAFGLMFVYFWIPNYAFTALSTFAWMCWIRPWNRELNVLTGMRNGLGLLNPLSTFDWNIVSMYDPLMYPSFVIFSIAAGMFCGGLVILALWYSNAWQTSYLPVFSSQAYDHFGHLYDVSQTVDARGLYDHDKFMQYSFPYLPPNVIVVYFFGFAVYSAVLTHVILYHRYEVALGFKGLWKSLGFGRERGDDAQQFTDVHARLMAAYKEAPEWWYMTILAASTALGCAGLAAWPTYTSPAVPFYGIALCIVFIVPAGIVTAMTGVPISLNILAEFFGGLIAEGNALALNFFKCYGFVTCYRALAFSNDLKVAHYLKIPPRVTFWAQIIGTLVSTIVSTGIMVFQMSIDNVCTDAATGNFSCPGVHTFFTSSVMWGTIGPRKTFGAGAPYQWLLLGFPAGCAVVLLFWWLRRLFPRAAFLRQIHLVAALYSGNYWSVYNFSYVWPAVPVAWFSWHYIRSRYLSFWSKYNFVLSAAFSAGIALSALLQFFSVQWTGAIPIWWGNTVAAQGCEAGSCRLRVLPEGGRFYPWWNSDAVPAP